MDFFLSRFITFRFIHLICVCVVYAFLSLFRILPSYNLPDCLMLQNDLILREYNHNAHAFPMHMSYGEELWIMMN